ncbi:MAG: polysaccharide export protein [Lachnospiraceae bacterium]|nr:polysaccharide export protein [Lachnospiraceae bacterium]
MNTTERDEVEIDLKELFNVLRSRLWMILLAAIVAAGITGSISKYMLTPVYESTTKLYIVNKSQSLSSLSLSDLQLGSQLTKDYMVLVKSRPVTEAVIANLGLDMTHEELTDIMSISNPTDTRILEITVEYPDAFVAKQIVDEIAQVSAARMAEIMDMKEPNIVEEGSIAKNPSSPNTLKNTVIGGMLGMFAVIAILTVMYLMDDTIKDTDDITRYLGLTTIGLVPVEEKNASGHRKLTKNKKR